MTKDITSVTRNVYSYLFEVLIEFTICEEKILLSEIVNDEFYLETNLKVQEGKGEGYVKHCLSVKQENSCKIEKNFSILL